MAKSTKTFPNVNKLSQLALAIVCANSSLVIAGPTGGSVTNGSADILGMGTDTTTINQGSATVTIDWATFNVDAGQEVIFNQTSSDIAINNIHDEAASNIMGNITAGGTVFLSNSNGFVFGANSSINTGSFLATTSNISLNGDEISLTDSSSNPKNNSDLYSISIHKDASINADQQSEGGYLAFISRDINIDSSTSADNTNSGLHAENGEILFSNDTTSSIKLAGLNINFPGSTISGSNAVGLDLTGADISSETVILTSANLADVLNSVIKQPSSISSKNLITSSSNIGDSISESTVEALKTSGFESLTLDYRGSNDFQLSTTINTTANRNLIINANSILLDNEHGNILGSELDLTLNADSVTIGNFSQEFGGPIGLGSITINATSSTVLQGNIHALGDISMTGNTSVFRDEGGTVTTKIRSENGSFNLNGTLRYSGTNDTTGNLYIRATGDSGITLGETSGFNFMDLNAQKLTLNGNITATDAISLNNVSEAHTNILINQDITLSADTIEFEDFYFTAKNNTNILTLDALSSSSNFSVKLKNSSLYTGNDLTPLNNLVIQNNNSGKDTKIILSGEFNTSDFSTASSDPDNQFNIDLAGDTSFFNSDTLNLSQTTLTGDYVFTAEANSNSSSSAQLGSIENLNGAQLSNFDKITLHHDISTKEGGLALNANDIILASSPASEPTITITNNSSGNITLDGDISSIDPGNLNSLSITSKNSNLSIGAVNSLANLSINKNLKDEGSTQLNGDINTAEDITLTNLGLVSVGQDTALTSTAGVISLADSSLSATDHNITLDATNIQTDAISAKNIYINTDTLNLNGDLSSDGDLDFITKENERVSLVLADDITLTGEINFLATATPKVTITGNKDLSIVSRNLDIFLATFNDDATELNSLSIETSDSNSETSTVHFAMDDDNLIILPELGGIQGLSLLGDMSANIGANQTFDTSSYNGNLDFSGVSINGSGSLTFNTGTGELSLGSIGANPTNEADIFTALNILSTGKLNLHGELNIFSEAYDFSHLNAIQLYTDLTLGSSEVPVNVDFGDATINGTFDLTLYSNELTLGVIGNNIALQGLTIFNTGDLTLDNDITTVGFVDINSTSLTLDNTITATGLDINIKTENDLIMSKDAKISAAKGDISLISTAGNVKLGELFADDSVTVRSEMGYLSNNIGDYVSDSSTSVNITSTNQYLYGSTSIGESVSNPIVVKALNDGTITAESGGTIFIANLENANIAATGRLLDSSYGAETASIDALAQFKLSGPNTINLPEISSNLNLISNLTWKVDDEESIRKIKNPTSSPSIYYSRGGWRLGQK
jgi:filamentous hemagglutinin family protein